jgi:hypothetical protein
MPSGQDSREDVWYCHFVSQTGHSKPPPPRPRPPPPPPPPKKKKKKKKTRNQEETVGGVGGEKGETNHGAGVAATCGAFGAIATKNGSGPFATVWSHAIDLFAIIEVVYLRAVRLGGGVSNQ